jgi:hypothetical protein
MAYVLRSRIHDPRIATTHDYRKKGTEDILASGITGWRGDAEGLAQAMSLAEKRGDACEGRSAIIAVPHELTIEQSAALVEDWCRHINKRHGVACAWVIHAPDEAGDERNVHAHVIVTGRRSNGDALGEKARELDDRKTGPAAIEEWRAVWGALAADALQQAGKGQPVDMRSWKRRLDAEGLPPDFVHGEEHLGPARSSAERRGRKTEAGNRNRRRRRRRLVTETLIEERRTVIAAGQREYPQMERDTAEASHVKQNQASSTSGPKRRRPTKIEKATRKANQIVDELAGEIAETARSQDEDQR